MRLTTDMHLTTDIRLVCQVLRAEVADSPLQFTLLHIAAPETAAFLPVDADEERVDALRLRAVALPELGRRDGHQRDGLVRADGRLELVVREEARGADGGDEVAHRRLDVRVEGWIHEAARLVHRVDLRSGPF